MYYSEIRAILRYGHPQNQGAWIREVLIIYNTYYMSQSVIWQNISRAGYFIFTSQRQSENKA